MANRRRTKNYFPYPSFQIRFIALLVGGAVAQVLAIGCVLYYFVRQNYMLLVKYGGLDQQITSLLQREFRFMSIVIAFTFVAFLAGITVIGVLFSHRIAGPIFAIKRTIREINSGKEVTLRFRKYDEWVDIATDFNRMVDLLRNSEKKTS